MMNSNENNEMKVFHWSEIRIVNRSIDKRMLLKDGFVDEIKCSLVNESPRLVPSQVRLVKFDREFISFQLAKILKPIAEANEKLLRDLIDEALFQLSNKTNENDSSKKRDL